MRSRVEFARRLTEHMMSSGKRETTLIEIPFEASPVVSVVVIGWRDAPHLIECLDSIVTAETSVPYEVIVTLNDPSNLLITELDRRVVGLAAVLRSEQNVGFGEANNQAVSKARAPYVMLLNDDVSVHAKWLDNSVALLDQNSQIGAVGSVLLNTDGSIQDAGCLVWRDGSVALLDHVLLDGHDPATRPSLYCSAAALLVRRDAFHLVGGFDPGYFPAYYEDVDLCFKFRSQGFETWINADSLVTHRRAGSTSRPFQRFLHNRNHKRFMDRWIHSLEHVSEPPSQKDLSSYFRDVRDEFVKLQSLVSGKEFGTAELPDSLRVESEDSLREQVRQLNAEYMTSLEESYHRFEEQIEALSEQHDQFQVETGKLRDEINVRDDQMGEIERQMASVTGELDRMRSRKVVRLADWISLRFRRTHRR